MKPIKNEKTNQEGFLDLTAYEAIENVTASDDHIANEFGFLLRVLKYIVRKAGFEVVGRIHLRHKQTGREFR